MQVTTGLYWYVDAFENEFGADVDYAMQQKHDGKGGAPDASAAVRYSPSKITSVTGGNKTRTRVTASRSVTRPYQFARLSTRGTLVTFEKRSNKTAPGTLFAGSRAPEIEGRQGDHDFDRETRRPESTGPERFFTSSTRPSSSTPR